MDDLISRQAAIRKLKRMAIHANIYKLTGRAETVINCCIDVIERQIPSAQPEIIACGDCKHWICHDRRCGYWNHGVKPLNWCCHAERRTDAV